MTLRKLFNLREGSDFEKSVETISEGVSLRGYNLWMLACSSILACVGLDTNSTAIIIGAMLISPLMSPILGVGLSVAVLNKKLLARSLRNLAVAVIISLCTSTFYFVISPLAHVTDELQSRTYPTLLDVIVALFGGLAGIISISRRSQTSAIPGVAIATALMPPLCTAGFGIAKADFAFFGGAFYLFCLNAIFISMATYLIVKYLHFPLQSFVDKRTSRIYAFWFNFLSVIAILPSVYFLYTVYKQQQRNDKLDRLVIRKIEEQGNEILKWDLQKKDSFILIKVYHSGNVLSDSLRTAIDSTLRVNDLAHYHVEATRVNLTKDEVSQLSADAARQMFNELQLEKATASSKAMDTISFLQVSKEIRTFMPAIDTAYNGWTLIPGNNNTIDTIVSFYYSARRRLSTSDHDKLLAFLKQRMNRDTAIIHYNEPRR